MPEVLDIRELGGEGSRPGLADTVQGGTESEVGSLSNGTPPRWRRSAALGVVVVLVLAVGYMLTLGRPGGGVWARVSDTASPPERAARAALDAWAAFGSTGDVEQLRNTFDPTGPQFERLTAEAPGVKARSVPGTPYRFSGTVLRASAGGDHDEQIVVADVVVTRPGETDQRFTWELVMRRIDGRWLLWTVHDRAAAAPLSSTGGAP